MTGKVGSRQAKEVGSRANKKRHPQKCFFTTIYSQYLIRFSPPTVFSLPTESKPNKKRHPQKCFFSTIYSQYLIRFSPPTVFSLPTAYCHPPTVISLPTAICLLPSAYSLRLLPSAY